MSEIIKTVGLHKTFEIGQQKVEVLKGIDLSIEKGEFASIMGASGSGKSTLLYLIGGLETPTSGNILIEGTDIQQLKDKEISCFRRQKLSYIFQFYNLIPNLTVEENILTPLILDGKKINNYVDRLEELLQLVGLNKYKKYVPSQLSGGQQQRVAIARSLITDADIILADEATGNLDSKMGNEVLRLMQKINAEQGKTILHVTHSAAAAAYGNRIIRIKDGRLESK